MGKLRDKTGFHLPIAGGVSKTDGSAMLRVCTGGAETTHPAMGVLSFMRGSM
jgi:hypothetical protein